LHTMPRKVEHAHATLAEPAADHLDRFLHALMRGIPHQGDGKPAVM
jgi:hypothetical protein